MELSWLKNHFIDTIWKKMVTIKLFLFTTFHEIIIISGIYNRIYIFFSNAKQQSDLILI